MHVINRSQNQNVKETTHTTGLILEVSVAIKLSSDDNGQPIILKNVLIDTGCTKTIIKRKGLQDPFFDSRKQLDKVSWTTNAGNS
jgi:hypothetical protein